MKKKKKKTKKKKNSHTQICNDKTYRYEFGKNILMNLSLFQKMVQGAPKVVRGVPKIWDESSRYQTVLERRLKRLVTQYPYH